MTTKARAITFDTFGKASEIAQVQSFNLPELGENDVLVKFLVSTVNPSDVMQVEGVYPTAPIYVKLNEGQKDVYVGGLEGVAEVIEVGSAITEHKKGDWVLPTSLGLGTWRSHGVFDKSAISAPLGLQGKATPAQIATSNINPITAYHLIKNYAKLEKGDWIIQNGGNSVVGRAVIQLAKAWGYKTISVVRSRDNLDELISDLKSLGADIVITEEQNADKEFDLAKLTGPDAHIKLALDCIQGTSGTNLIERLEQAAHHVTYGSMTLQPISITAGPLIFKDITFHGYWLKFFVEKNRQLYVQHLSEILGLVVTGKLKTPQVEKHLISSEKSDDENTKIARDALKSYTAGYTNKKHIFVWESN